MRNLRSMRQADGQVTFYAEGVAQKHPRFLNMMAMPIDQLCDVEGNCTGGGYGGNTGGGNPGNVLPGKSRPLPDDGGSSYPSVPEPQVDTPVTTPELPSTTPPSSVEPETTPEVDPDADFADASLEVDFYAISCIDLDSLIKYAQNKLMSGKFSQLKRQYYLDKITAMEAAFSSRSCKVGTDVVDIQDPDSTTPDPVETKPTDEKKDEGLGGLLQSLLGGGSPAGGGGGGGGGEAGGKKPVEKAKTNWLLWAVAIAALGVSLYKGRNTTINMGK